MRISIGKTGFLTGLGIALLTLSTYTFAQGYRTDIRGGNPWTTRDPSMMPVMSSGQLPRQPKRLSQWSGDCQCPSQAFGSEPQPTYANPAERAYNYAYATPYTNTVSPLMWQSPFYGFPGGLTGLGVPWWANQPFGIGAFPGTGLGLYPGISPWLGMPNGIW